VNESELVIDRPKGSKHKTLKDFVYEVDYGYLKDTKSMDKGGIDIWKGTLKENKICGIFCIIDLYRKDSEIKILMGCTDDEIKKIKGSYDNLKSLGNLLVLKQD
jgi:inorganic pyrophosphatase